MMVEVFKTNVKHAGHARMILDQIHKTCIDYTANFDLEDCDNILRVKSGSRLIEPSLLIDLLRNYGFTAEVLPDELPALNNHGGRLVCN
jgi:hypothetical protein